MNDVFAYDSNTGVLTWKIRPWVRSHVYPGDVAGSAQESGHLIVKYQGKRYYVHRLVWFLTYGAWPTMIDHIDGDPQNNRIGNLKETTYRANACNKQMHRAGKLPGARYHKRGRKWLAYADINGKNTYLGSSDTEAGAHEIYKQENLK